MEQGMRQFTRFYREIRITYLKAAAVSILTALLLFPAFEPLKQTGENAFTVFLNGENAGVTDEKEKAEQLLQKARMECADENGTLLMAEAVLTTEGKQLWWGRIDSDEMILSNLCGILKKNEVETSRHAYTVKIKDYLINLGGAEEVQQFLQAALDKYQTSQQFVAELAGDGTRELNVLTPVIRSEKELAKEDWIVPEAGAARQLTEMTRNIESTAEKSFDDYEYGLVDLAYGDQIEVVEGYLPQSSIMNLQEAIHTVTKEELVDAVYEIQPGDTLSEISLQKNVPLDKLIEINDSLEDENSIICAGDELIISVPEPKLSMERREEVYYEEDYEAETEYIYNEEWYTTDSVLRQQPSAGHRKVAALVSYRNEKVTDTQILKEEITCRAIPKIVEVGTKIPPTYIKPISGGRLSSGFGRRNAPTRGASSYHKGIDWATPVGTAVCASSAGVVTRAGWGSGYGYVIYIDHADGRQTRYGHLSKILVSPGQSVKQGEKIALSGNTGRSTGPHIHFEILIGGTQVNPLEYLN